MCEFAIHFVTTLLLKHWIMSIGGGDLVTKSCPTLTVPWTVACQALLSMGFSRQEYWSGLPFLSPGVLPDSRIKPSFPAFSTSYHLSYRGTRLKYNDPHFFPILTFFPCFLNSVLWFSVHFRHSFWDKFKGVLNIYLSLHKKSIKYLVFFLLCKWKYALIY